MKSSRRLPWVLSALGWLGSAALAAAPPPAELVDAALAAPARSARHLDTAARVYAALGDEAAAARYRAQARALNPRVEE